MNANLFADDDSDSEETGTEISDESSVDESQNDDSPNSQNNEENNESDEGKEDENNSAKSDDEKSDETKSDEAKNDETKSDEKSGEAKSDETKDNAAKDDAAKSPENQSEVVSSHGEGENYIVDYGDHQDSLQYDNVYDSNNEPIYHSDNKELEQAVYDYFYDEWASRTKTDANVLASRYLEASEAYENAVKNGEEKSKIEEAQRALDDAKNALDKYCEHYDCYWQADDKKVTVVTNSEHKLKGFAGDPVSIAFGKFVIDDNDISIANGKKSFCIERHYVSNGFAFNTSGNEEKSYLERTHGVFGPLWTSNLDTRIIRGCATELLSKIVEERKNYAEKLSEVEKKIADCAKEDSECEPILEEIRQEIEENAVNLESSEKKLAESKSAENFNKFVDYGKPGSFNGNLSSEILIFCDDNGGMIIFEKSNDDSEIYVPSSSVWKNKLALSSEQDGFLLTFINSGEKRHYSNFGLPIKFEYENGSAINFNYDEDFRLSKIYLDSFHCLEFSWGGNDGNLLASISDGNQKFTYGYDDEKLISVTDFENDTKKFEYDSEGFLTKQIKADGNFISFEYKKIDNDDVGKVVSSVINEEGKAEHFDYDFDARKTIYTDCDGISTVFFYDEKNRTTKIQYADGSEENWTLDESGNVISWNDGNSFAKYDYDACGKILEKNNETGSNENFSYSENKLVAHKNKYGVVENYSYDENGNVSAIFIGGEIVKSFSYKNGLLDKETDCRGNSFLYFYDEKGNLSQIYLLEKGKTQVLLESYEYDSQNRIKKYVGMDGITRNFIYENHKITIECSNSVKITKIYSSRKILLSEEFEDKITGEKFKKEYEYDKNRNCKYVYISGKNSDGFETNHFLLYEYDYTPAGKISRQILWNFSEMSKGEKSGIETSYIYDGTGNLCEIKKCKIDGVQNGIEKITRLSAERTQNGSRITEISGEAEKSFLFDISGNLIEEKAGGTLISAKNYSSAGMLLSEKFGSYGGRNYEYGADGFLCSFSEENSAKSQNSEILYFADGKIKEIINAVGIKSSFEYNGLGMLVRVSSPLKITEYKYDSCGKLISKTVKNASNVVIYDESWIYSDFGRQVFHKIGGEIVEKLVKNGFGMLKSKSDSVENLWIYSYDILGRKIQEKNPYGKITTFEWNESNLIKKITRPDGSYKKFDYDLDSNCIKIEDNAGIILKAEYDDYSRLVSVLERPFSVPEKYEYDDFGRVTKITKAGKTLLSNSYDDSKMQIKRTDANGNSSFWNFDSANYLLSSVNRNGSFSKNEWNSAGMIESSTDFNGTASSYSYGNFGLETKTNFSNGEFSYASYDVLQNLSFAENENCSLSFEYNSAENLIYQKDSVSGAEIFFEYENGRLSKISSNERKISYEYGKCGELLKITDCPKIESSNQTIEILFEYDSCGREISRKWSTGESMKIYYDEAGREILRTGFSSSHGLVFAEGCVYDENGAKSLVLTSDFNYKRYKYDDFGRVKSVSYPYSEEKSEYLKSLLEDSGIFSLSGSENFSYESLSVSEHNQLQKICSLAGFGATVSAGMKKSIEESFEYDLNSNLVKRTTSFGSISYAYDENDRLVSWGNGCSAKYDANGNMIFFENAKKQIQMEYNASNRLKKVLVKDYEKDETSQCFYEYDALGRRVKSAISGKGTTETCYIGNSGTEFYSLFTPEISSKADSFTKTRSGKFETKSKIRYKFHEYGNNETDFDANYDIYDENDDLNDLSNSNSRTKSANPDSSAYFASKEFPLFSQFGEILYLASETDDSNGERLSFMAGNTGTVSSFIDDSDLLSELEYSEFGTPIVFAGKKSAYGFSGKKFDSKTELYDFGYRDYAPNFGRFSTEDPILDGRNWYSYCAGDYVNFCDPNGLEMKIPNEQYMQSMGENTLLGNSPKEKAKEQGCVVTYCAESFSEMIGIQVEPSFINNNKTLFDAGSGDMNWSKLEKNYGLVHTAVETKNLKSISDEKSGFCELSEKNQSAVWNLDTQNARSIANYIANTMESSKEMVVALQVVYGYDTKDHKRNDKEELLHFVVASGNIEMINGKSYVGIIPTSEYDKTPTNNTYRKEVDWIVKDGKTYVSADLIRRVDTLSKNN